MAKIKFDYEKIVNLYLQHKDVSIVEQEIGCSKTTVCYVLKKFGINVRRKSKYNFDVDYFEKIDTEEKAYWLGFLYADGYVNTINRHGVYLTLAYKDIEHLKKFKKSLNGNNDIVIINKKLNNKIFKQCSIKFYSKKIASDLSNLGCVQNKTFKLKFPNNKIVPDYLINHFIRGYFDGDGSVFISNEKHWRHGHVFPVIHFRFLGTLDFLSNIQKILNIGGTLIKSKNSDIYELSYKRRKKAKIFMEYLYKDATIYLERKYQIFKDNL